MILFVGNYYFNSSDILNVRGADGCDSGLFVTFSNCNIKHYFDISLEDFFQALKKKGLNYEFFIRT